MEAVRNETVPYATIILLRSCHLNNLPIQNWIPLQFNALTASLTIKSQRNNRKTNIAPRNWPDLDNRNSFHNYILFERNNSILSHKHIELARNVRL